MRKLMYCHLFHVGRQYAIEPGLIHQMKYFWTSANAIGFAIRQSGCGAAGAALRQLDRARSTLGARRLEGLKAPDA